METNHAPHGQCLIHTKRRNHYDVNRKRVKIVIRKSYVMSRVANLLILTFAIALTMEKAIKTLEASSKCYILLVIIFIGMPKDRR